MKAEHRKQVDALQHALGEREKQVDTMQAEWRKDADKWKRERDAYLKSHCCDRQKMEDLQSHFAREREREEENELEREKERGTSKEELKRVVDREQAARDEKEKTFREMEAVLREREKERAVQRGKLEDLAAQVDSLTGLLRETMEEKDSALGDAEKARDQERRSALEIARNIDVLSEAHEERDQALQKLQVLERERETAKEREGEWGRQRKQIEFECLGLREELKRGRDIEQELRSDKSKEREQRKAAEARCTMMQGRDAQWEAREGALEQERTDEQLATHALICRAEHLLFVLDDVLTHKMPRRLQEFVSAKSGADATQDRILREWADEKREMARVKEMLERERNNVESAERKVCDMTDTLHKEMAEAVLLRTQIAQLQDQVETHHDLEQALSRSQAEVVTARNEAAEDSKAKDKMLKDVVAQLAAEKQAAQDAALTQHQTEKMLSNARAQLIDVQEQMQVLKDRAIAAEKDEVDCRAKLTGRESQLSLISSERDSLLHQCEKQRQTTEAIKAQKASDEAQLLCKMAVLTAEVETAVEEGKNTALRLQDLADQHSQEVQDLTEKLNAANSALLQADQHVQEQASAASDLQIQLARKTSQVPHLEQEIEHLHGVLDTWRQQAAEV